MYKKKFPIIVAATIVAISIFLMWHQTSAKETNYYDYATSLDLIEIVDVDDLTLEEINNRNGKLIIERVIGVVDDAETGFGHAISNKGIYPHINYSEVPGIKDGDVICTFFIYNPDNNYEDDIIADFHYIIDGKE